jgi:hypothetical protein
MMILSALIRSLPFVLTKWQLAVMGWMLYIFAAFLIDDDTEYV